MADPHDIGERDTRPDARRGAAPEGLDKDIHVGRIALFIAGIAILLGIAALAGILLFTAFRGALIRRDPSPPALPEARARVLPPEPRLQLNPILDMDAYRAREQAILSSYGWADREASTARIPIERAVELYLSAGKRAALSERLQGGPPGSSLPDAGSPGSQGSGPADVGLSTGSVLDRWQRDAGVPDGGLRDGGPADGGAP